MAHVVVSRLGWRWAYAVFGVAVLLALNGLALALLVFAHPPAPRALA